MLRKDTVLRILDDGGMLTWNTLSDCAHVWTGTEHRGCYPLRFAKALSRSGKFYVRTTSRTVYGRLVFFTVLSKEAFHG